MPERRRRPRGLTPLANVLWDHGLEASVGTGRELADLIRDAGIGTAGDRYQASLALVILWHLGKTTSEPILNVGLRPIDAHAATVIKRRAYELVDTYRHRLPAIVNDRPLT